MSIAPVAVLTNASLFNQEAVRKSLSLADFVIAKLDSSSQEMLENINRPDKTIRFNSILNGIRKFRQVFKGKFALQMMFVKQNLESVKELARLARTINPDEVQINTPTRLSGERPLTRDEISGIKRYFKGLNFISVYDIRPKRVGVFSRKQTAKRRGMA